MDEAADYKYDIFISYPHQADHQLWVHDIFLPKFTLYLLQELYDHPKIYIDKDENIPGTTWALKIKEALARSRILIPVWSVNYFKSYWCKAECAVLRHREKRLGYRTYSKPEGLILPVTIFNCEKHPPIVELVASLDCAKYGVIHRQYEQSPAYPDFLTEILKWSKAVAHSIRTAPPWNPEWLTDEWLETPINSAETDPEFQFPREPFTLKVMA